MDKESVNKINLVYDATVLGNDCNREGGRTGIFWVVYQVLSELVKRDNFNISLYCSENDVNVLRKVLSTTLKEFSNLRIANKTNLNAFEKAYDYLKRKKDNAKGQNNKILKNLLHIPMYFFELIMLFKKPFSDENKWLKETDVFLSPVFKIPPEVKKAKHIKKYVILYDTVVSLFPEYFPEGNHWFRDLLKSLNEEDTYFAISESTKNDFIKITNNPDLNIIVSLLAASDRFCKCTDETKIKQVLKKYKIPTDKKYIFSLFAVEPRKNIIRIIKTFIDFINKNKINDLMFVIGGDAWDEFKPVLDKELENLSAYENSIFRIGYVDDEDVPVLYSGAQWYVYTSQYEGFGLPPLEAMQCGCPVITSNNSSLPEVVADAGVMIDYDSDQQHIAAYEKLYFNHKLRNEYAQKGLERAKLFSWEKCAKTIEDEIIKNAKQ